ncbi:MAG: hypothetical protein LBQ66_08245 [Planctomycetaceae bacterium]|nr:hypothetical protein [Planctomycetaceae bacterium]
MGNRPPGGYVGVLADNGGGLRIDKTQTPYVLGVLVNQHVLAIRCFRLGFARRKRNRPAVGCPPYEHQHVLAFSSNFFGSITHRGGRDARVPVLRRFAANLCGITRRNRPAVGLRLMVGCPPYDHQCFSCPISLVASYRR